jgi:hypothetical protein
LDYEVKKSGSIPYLVARFHPFGNPDADTPCMTIGAALGVEKIGAAGVVDVIVVVCGYFEPTKLLP